MSRLKLVLTTAVLATCMNVHASPVQLTETDFTAAISGLTSQVEDFESYSGGGVFSSPFVFSNGTYSDLDGANVSIVTTDTFCGDTNDKCLANQTIAGPKEFSGLVSDTVYWGADLTFASDLANDFDVQVVGGSGTLSINFVAPSLAFLGFYDPLGISSIKIENSGSNGGFGNFAFDDITTAQNISAVPIPAAAPLFAGALGVLGIFGWRRRRAT